ncbi:MAG: saccharopine dehydrogenase [Marinicaulis sp.]|nr:saccharopine dehydrogenase NADP-binding domain-containing protein [Marinicaulis sp.]NNE40134.1 saccharopine dehydrogenase [Marinicaulis sp.]
MSYANHAEKEFDIVVFGASGYTGRLVAEYLDKNYTGSLNWAMAGRNEEKLKAVREEIGANEATPILLADAADMGAIEDLCKKSKVILTTVGPYQLYGNELVAACAKTGADYVDLCGEPAWMRQMIDAHGATAKSSGARIVFSCGFDSIPFDLGVQFLQDAAQDKFNERANEIHCIVRKMKGTFSGGTAASLKATMAAAFKDPSVIELLKNPFALAPGFDGPRQPSGSKPKYDEELGIWLAPFVMAPINTKNVHRSNALLGHSYGEDFKYSEMVATGPGVAGEKTAQAVASDNSLMGEDAPKPGEGPTKEEREGGHYDVLFIGETASGKTISASVTGDMDPGYGSTSKMIAEAAACLIDNCDAIGGGIWTPAAAMNGALRERLVKNAGLTFEIE